MDMDTQTFETKRLEYQMAQEMLRHYDSLNWQIGSILVAAAIVLTGLALNKDTIELAYGSLALRLSISAGIPLMSLFVLVIWLLWFRRHRALYNFRNEVLHRLEEQLGMYHFLLVAESNGGDKSRFDKAKTAAGHQPEFKPLYRVTLPGPSGYDLTFALAFGVPVGQAIILFMAYWA